ncbi:MAG TPA: bifunctional adenosylcobinamide kinase/adenosylcobinamide-phosphate guanylyltransferase [Candidatus Blautia intestinigallinarum]|nr:bifunctional adenosylcobinamide kinase/adenosylcobinamide-phosphate guanylyltransferase [Candidatus Blautia intestinigallinarum]
MELIVGGAFQGQLDYAKRLFPMVKWTDGAVCSKEELCSCEGVFGFQEYIRRTMREGRDVMGLTDLLIRKNPDILIVSEEVGYGVVPVDPFDRSYREAVGRVCTGLAAYAKRVHRVICGVGTVIKDD